VPAARDNIIPFTRSMEGPARYWWMSLPVIIPKGVDDANKQKAKNVRDLVKVLRTIFSARAKPAVPLWAMTAMKINTAAAGSLIPRAIPRKNDGRAIITVMIIGKEAGDKLFS